MALSFAFGGDTGTSYEQLQRRRKYAQGLMTRSSNSQPKNVWEGLNSGVGNLVGALMLRKANAQETEGREGATTEFNALQHLMGQRYGGGQTPGLDANSSTQDVTDYAGGAIDGPSAMIREFEGYRENPYFDVNAFRAGYGSDTVTMPDGSVVPITEGMTVSRDDAERDLDRRVNTEFMPSARNAVGGEVFDGMNNSQQSSLTSLAYNYGAGAWEDDLAGVARAARSGGDVSQAIAALSGHNGGVNSSRREREAAAFGGGTQVAQNGGLNPQLMEAMSNPYMSRQQQTVLSMLFQQQLMANAPLSQLDQVQLDQARLNLEQDRNPTPGPREHVTDANGRLRFLDDQTFVFPDLEMTPQAPDPTTAMQNYQFYTQQEQEAGREPQSFNVWNLQSRRAGAANFTNNIGGPSATTVGQEALDKRYAPEHLTWTRGGAADMNSQIAQIEGVAAQLEAIAKGESDDNLTGPVLGSVPDRIRAMTNPGSLAARQRVEEVVQRNLRLILGAQFTEKEGERLIARAYDDNLSEAENASRLRRLIGAMRSAAASRQSQSDYFTQHGTIADWQGDFPSIEDFHRAIDGTASTAADGNLGELTDEQIRQMLEGN